MNKLFSDFMNPQATYRGKPFWSWNGKLEKDELIRQVHVMKEMGFGGFFMHSRTGLQTEYLGEEWFDLINACADEAERLGMEAWLYDEDRWPSGIAGGMVTENPEFRMKSVKLNIMAAGEFKWKDDILAAFSCKLEGVNYSECKRIYNNTPVNAYEGMSILVFTVCEMDKHSFYNGFTYLDTLNRKATDRFIELTHEKYKEKCGERFGKTIKGIFTDEPHRGTLMDAFGAGNGNDIRRAPWTGSLSSEFERKYGIDLIDSLPEIFLMLEGQTVSQIKWRYVDILLQLFVDNFLIPINQWCMENNIILTGHLLHEDSLTAQTVMCGSLMRCYEYMEYPGVDVLTEGNRNYWIVKQLASVSSQLGKKMLLSELYGGTGWQMGFEGHKAVGDWQALFGINMRCHHLSWYTMEGESKRDFPGSILHQSAWWKEYSHVEDYFSRIGTVMSQGKACCDVLVINPVESIWCRIYAGYSYMLEAVDEEIIRIEEKYRSIFRWLSGAQISFDYGDEDIMGRLCSIIPGEDGKTVLKVGEAPYSVVVVAGMITIRESTLKILNEFIDAGGQVIFAGDPPGYVDAVKSISACRTAEKSMYIPFEKQPVIETVKNSINSIIEVINCESENVSDILCRMTDDGKSKYIMLLNVNTEKAYKNIKIKVKSEGYAEEWICSTGERYVVGESMDGCIEILTDFEACGEHIFVITPERNPEIKVRNELIDSEAYIMNGPYQYELDEPNICVLDIANYKLDGDRWSSEEEILKIDRKVRRKLGIAYRGGEMLQPWFSKKEECIETENLSLKYEFYIENMPHEPVELVMERPEIHEIFINGQLVDSTKVTGWWIDKCFKRLYLSADSLKAGLNTIIINTEFNHSVNLEAIYLLGQFGVKLDGTRKILVGMTDRVKAEDLTSQGFPFYTGKIKYKLDIGERLDKGGRLFVSVEKFEGACIKVISRNTEKVIAWQPYELEITDYLNENNQIDLEVVLTRRNTFGPLHQIPLYTPAYSPENYIFEEDNFTKSYMLIPSGLLSEPKLVSRQDR